MAIHLTPVAFARVQRFVAQTPGALGLRFGMTGVLVADGSDTLDELVYGPSRRDPAWVRLVRHTLGTAMLP